MKEAQKLFSFRKNLQLKGEDVENASQNGDARHGQVNNAAAAHRGASVSDNSSIGSP